jgi:hypothetical protein
MPAQEMNDCPATAYTWFVLMQLDQHRERSMGVEALKIKDLALYKGNSGPEDRRRAAEVLAMPLMNLYSALGKAGLADTVTMDQAKQKIVGVLVDGEKTILDLAAAFEICYRFPDETRPKGKGTQGNEETVLNVQGACGLIRKEAK